MKFLILAIGKLKGGGHAESFAEYQKRLRGALEVREFDLRESNPVLLRKKESETLLNAVPEGAYVIACDAAGKPLSSRGFAEKLGRLRENGVKTAAFLIGGADGHTPGLLKKADFALSFGTMTWPHRLARVMLAEQLYRAEAIAAGCPYHRE